MNIFKLIYVLYKMRVLSPTGLCRLTVAVLKYGINLMTLLYFAESTYGEKTALVYEDMEISYSQLFSEVERLASALNEKYGLKWGQKVGFLCKNHDSLVKSIFAVSLLGADIYLLNAEMSSIQLEKLLGRHDFDLIIYDFELEPLIEQAGFLKEKILSYHHSLPAINNLTCTVGSERTKLRRSSSGRLVLLSGGTTGNFKEAVHKPSIFNYLNPFLTLIEKLKLLDYSTAYVATPIYHGYGAAVLLLFTALGKKVVINCGFDAEKACGLVRRHKVEVVVVVPLMIYKMLRCSVEDLKSLSCIVSGGAELSPRLVEETLSSLGDVLYNLYGTSEAGLNIVATPRDLRYSAKTIGRKVKGAVIKVIDDNRNEAGDGRIGRLFIKNSWSMRNSRSSFIETGDLGCRDHKGYYYLCGRVDDMIVSAGENVYPVEVEQILINHPKVGDVAVIGVKDEIFGQRLKAFVQLVKNADVTQEELFEWLRQRAARYQSPKEIVFVDNIPYTPLGKLDKNKLKMEFDKEG